MFQFLLSHSPLIIFMPGCLPLDRSEDDLVRRGGQRVPGQYLRVEDDVPGSGRSVSWSVPGCVCGEFGQGNY